MHFHYVAELRRSRVIAFVCFGWDIVETVLEIVWTLRMEFFSFDLRFLISLNCQMIIIN